MNTAAAIIVALFVGALFVVLIGGIATLIVLHIRGQRSAKEHAAAMSNFAAKMEALLGKSQIELTSVVESARASFTGVRQDIKASQDAQAGKVEAALVRQEKAFEEKIGSINGEMLQTASLRAVHALRDLSGLAVSLRNLLHEHEAQPGKDLAPEEYAPSDTIYDTQNQTGRKDAAAIVEEMDLPEFSVGVIE